MRGLCANLLAMRRLKSPNWKLEDGAEPRFRFRSRIVQIIRNYQWDGISSERRVAHDTVSLYRTRVNRVSSGIRVGTVAFARYLLPQVFACRVRVGVLLVCN